MDSIELPLREADEIVALVALVLYILKWFVDRSTKQ